jgi:hypothetical protein
MTFPKYRAPQMVGFGTRYSEHTGAQLTKSKLPARTRKDNPRLPVAQTKQFAS